MSKKQAKRKIDRTHIAIILVLFALAFCVRLVYVIQISDVPYFDNPAGDSRYFLDRAQEILAGNVLGHTVPFYSSPLYPYFIAAVFWLFGQHMLILCIIQILIGSANCVVIYLIARKISEKGSYAPVISAACAVMYGLLVFFDADMLQIFMTLLFIDCGLYFLISFQEARRLYKVVAAGLAIGLAALDRTNVLLFVPIAMWYIASGFTFTLKKWKIKPALIFLACVIGVILPVTMRNIIVGRDVVLVSSNAGVNLYIGNNPDAPGVFFLPQDSELSNDDLDGTAQQIAERTLGRDLSPSQVSGYWAERAGRFMIQKPLKTAGLLLNKFLMFWNAYEVPNNLDYYFVREYIAPVLKFTFMGFWLLAPIAVLGILWRWRRGLHGGEKLLVAFLITYMISVLPFFITERYRLPIVPVLIMFTGFCITDIIEVVRTRRFRDVLFVFGGIVLVAVFVNWPRIRFDQARMRTIMGTRYLDRALLDLKNNAADLGYAVIHLKWAAELRPQDLHVRYELGRTYASLGYYSGAIRELEQILAVDPGRTTAQGALAVTRMQFEKTGDLMAAQALPMTPFERAVMSEHAGSYVPAREAYRALIKQDPFHFQAYHRLSAILQQHGRSDQALAVLKKGHRLMPHNILLLYDLGVVYYRMGEEEHARQVWQKCLKIEPNNTQVQDALDLLR
ncbi:MAG: tetratricopeptide repeat protein [candidate division WOR-3 bacterium]|nr:MAG: tetratricopeptide repeat protein [candidate division WOR-3 bacterium]